jgi:hypothetical protein
MTGVGRFLSRRDRVIVAWQFSARDIARKRFRPVGNGMNSWSWRYQVKILHCTTQALAITPFPPGRVFAGRHSRQ